MISGENQETVTVTVDVFVEDPVFTEARTLQVPFFKPLSVAPTTLQEVAPEVTFKVTVDDFVTDKRPARAT